MGLSNYDIRHFERPDDSYPDYDRYFGYGEFDEEFEPEEDIDDIVDEYLGEHADEIVDEYWKMGPADESYMEEVRRQWRR